MGRACCGHWLSWHQHGWRHFNHEPEGNKKQEFGFAGLSRSSGARVPAPDILSEWSLNVDLHTRKERDVAAYLEGLETELAAALERPWCCVMLHHQLMTESAFVFVERLIELVCQAGWNLVNLGQQCKNSTAFR